LDERFAIASTSHVHGVYVGDEAMAKTKRFVHGAASFWDESPWLFGVPWIIRRMETQDRREDAKLYPSCCKLVISIALHMATNIMAPPAISNVGGS